MNRLRQMSVFAHIVEAGSISSAAESLELSKSVVSQHLKALELELGMTLLKRTTRRQALTSAGERFYANCRELNQIVDMAWLDAQESLEVPKGRVRITAPNALMETLVTPVIGDLLHQYPLLEPELISSDQHLDFLEHNIDLAIRVGQSKDSNLKQRRIGQFRDVLCGRLSENEDIQALPYIANAWQGKEVSHHFKVRTDLVKGLSGRVKSKSVQDIHYEKEARCITNSFHSCLSMINAGAGIGLIPDFYLPLIEPALVAVFPNHDLPTNSVYALNPYSKQLPLSVAVCIDAIEQQLTQLVK